MQNLEIAASEKWFLKSRSLLVAQGQDRETQGKQLWVGVEAFRNGVTLSVVAYSLYWLWLHLTQGQGTASVQRWSMFCFQCGEWTDPDRVLFFLQE